MEDPSRRVAEELPDGSMLWVPGVLRHRSEGVHNEVGHGDLGAHLFVLRGQNQSRKVKAAMDRKRQLYLHSLYEKYVVGEQKTKRSDEEDKKNGRRVHFDDNSNTTRYFWTFDSESDDNSSISSSDEIWAELGFDWMVKAKKGSQRGHPRSQSTATTPGDKRTGRVGRIGSLSTTTLPFSSPPKVDPSFPMVLGDDHSSSEEGVNLHIPEPIISVNKRRVGFPRFPPILGNSFPYFQVRHRSQSSSTTSPPVPPLDSVASNVPVLMDVHSKPKTGRLSLNKIVPKRFRSSTTAGDCEAKQITESWALYNPDEDSGDSKGRASDRKGLLTASRDVVGRLRRH